MFGRDGDGVELELDAFCHVEHPRLVRLLTLHCGDPEQARDLAQETLVRVCTHWRKVRRMDVPQAWVTRVALNLSLSAHRRRTVQRRAVSELRAVPPEPQEDPTEAAMVRAALMELPERQRAALILRYFQDLTVEQTAACLDVSPSAVKKLTARGIDQLRGRLGTDIDATEVR